MQKQHDDPRKDPKAPQVQDPNRSREDKTPQQEQHGGHRRQDNSDDHPQRQR